MTTIHLPAIPHTVTRPDFSSCAFTQKVRHFPQMLAGYGWRVVHYGVESSEVGQRSPVNIGLVEHVDLMSLVEHEQLLGHPLHENPWQTIGDDATEEKPVYEEFNARFAAAVTERFEPGDFIALPFGRAHGKAISLLPSRVVSRVTMVESGIGYGSSFLPNRIYESQAWRHYVMAKEKRVGMNFATPRWEFVIPNYYDVREWTERAGVGGWVIYLGRLQEHKGVELIPRLARAHPDITFKVCGQGDPKALGGYVPANVEVLPPVRGRERDALLGNAIAVLCPSRFTEPFCGVHVEAQLCGTPVITSDFGVFTETVRNGFNGWRCQTFGDYVAAIHLASEFDVFRRRAVAQHARAAYGLDAVGARYDRAFRMMQSGAVPGDSDYSSFVANHPTAPEEVAL